jgi:hypothetical protein
MEDDKNVTSLSVETDTWLGSATDATTVHLIITVDIRAINPRGAPDAPFN